MANPVVFMFSGQGSQYYQMGKELFEHNQVFNTWMQKLDAIVKRFTSKSILELIYDKENKKQDRKV